jgi:hypothetical protein
MTCQVFFYKLSNKLDNVKIDLDLS